MLITLCYEVCCKSLASSLVLKQLLTSDLNGSVLLFVLLLSQLLSCLVAYLCVPHVAQMGRRDKHLRQGDLSTRYCAHWRWWQRSARLINATQSFQRVQLQRHTEQLCSPQEPCSCNSKYRPCVLRGSTLPASKNIKMQTSMPLHTLFPETQPSRWRWAVPLGGVAVCTPLN